MLQFLRDLLLLHISVHWQQSLKFMVHLGDNYMSFKIENERERTRKDNNNKKSEGEKQRTLAESGATWGNV